MTIKGKLSVRKIRDIKEPGRYGDGGGLYLYVRKGGSRQWILRTTINRRPVDLGLGSTRLVSLAQARELALEKMKAIKEGRNPLAEKKERAAIPDFETAAREVYEEKKGSWKNPAHIRQWIQTLEDYAFPIIGKLAVSDIESSHIRKVLSPIWTKKEESARRLKQRMKVVFDWVIVEGHRKSANPVIGIEQALPKQTGKVKHHEALTWKKLPKFMVELEGREGVSAFALRFLILTVGRSDEIRDARWDEISFRQKLWSIPGEKMKMEKPHRVPLSPQAIAVLHAVKGLSEDFVFPGQKPGRALSNSAFSAVMIKMGYETLTAHGFRSTFKDWCSEEARADWEVSELALAHQVGNKTERAYARSDLLERRRPLMNEWASYAYGKTLAC